MKKVNISMQEFLLEELDYMANKRGMSRSGLLAMLVSDEFMKMQREGNINEDFYQLRALEAYQAYPYE